MTKATVKYIQSLAHKKGRAEQNVFFAEGPKVVSELIQQGFFNCTHVFCLDDYVAELSQMLENTAYPAIEPIQAYELEKISALTTPNKVLAVFEQKQPFWPQEINKGFSILLDDIQDPGNLGTIVRIADWFGVEHIFCTPSTADLYNPKVVQSTMASLGRVNVNYTELANVFEKYPTMPVYAAVLNGKPISSKNKYENGFIVIGNESKGISPEILKFATDTITINKIGEAESLNAAVATGIILHSFLS
jgi:RNA methyltransferase, TrmH family